MSLGSSGSTQTTVQQSKPLPWQKKLFNQTSDDALSLYRGGGGMNTGSMVVPWSKQTMGAMDGIMGNSQWNANNRNGITNQAQDIIRQGGFNDYQQGALNNMQGQLRQLGGNGLSNAQDQAMANYRNLANSDYSFKANPGSQGVLDSILRDTTNSVNAGAAAAGRYGGGLHQGRLAQDIGDASSQFRMNDYNQWLGRRDAANNNMASLGQQGVTNQQGLTGNIFNAAQTGLGNMNSAYQAQMSPYQSMMGVGSMNEDLMRRQMDDQSRIQNLPWEQIMRLQAVGSGMGNYNTSTSTAPGPNPFLQTLGQGASIANMLGLGF